MERALHVVSRASELVGCFGSPPRLTYSNTHPELIRQMDISRVVTVAALGGLDAKKAKDEWQEMKTQSTCIVADSSVADNDDGQRAASQHDYSFLSEDMVLQ